MDLPLDEKLGTMIFFKQKKLGLKEIEVDSGVLKLAIVHLRVLIHQQKIICTY